MMLKNRLFLKDQLVSLVLVKNKSSGMLKERLNFNGQEVPISLEFTFNWTVKTGISSNTNLAS